MSCIISSIHGGYIDDLQVEADDHVCINDYNNCRNHHEHGRDNQHHDNYGGRRDADLILYYTFDEDGGTNVIDQSGRGNDAVASGAARVEDPAARLGMRA